MVKKSLSGNRFSRRLSVQQVILNRSLTQQAMLNRALKDEVLQFIPTPDFNGYSPVTPNLKSEVYHPQPQTRNPPSVTPNPKSSTRNPKPEILHPKP